MLSERLETLLVGNATGVVNAFREGGTAADAFGAKTTTTGKLMRTLGLQGLSTGQQIQRGLQVGTALGGIAIAKMAFDGVKHFADLTGSVRGFQRVTGASAEDSSRLAAATSRMGIDAGTAQTAFGQLQKRIGEGKDTLGQWGVEIVKNRDGTINFSATLANVSEKYASLKDSTQRAAFASENFGKGYMSINALLGQGKANLQDFYKVAEEHHQIFSQEDLDKGLQFNRAMHDLESAFQGLELQLGEMVIPLLTGAAHVGEAFVEVLDAIAGSSEGASIAAVAFATAIGAAFFGPVGAAIGLGVSLVGVLSSGADAAKNFADGAAGLAKKIDQLDTAQAVAAWDRYIRKAAEFVPQADSVAARLKTFHALADADPAAAQKLIQGWDAQGLATGRFKNELDQVVQKHAQQKTNADAAKAANDGLVSSQDQSTGAIKANVAALDEQAKALQQVQSLLLQSQGGEIGRQQAVIAATKAQDDFNTAVVQYGPDSAQARDASLNLQSARLQEAQSSLDAKKAQDDLIASVKNNPAAVDAEIAKLQESIVKYGDADGAIQSQINYLQGYKDSLATVPPAVSTKANVDTAEAHAKIDALNTAIAGVSRSIEIGVTAVGDAVTKGWLQKGP